ncbi:hypothetical protein ES708_16862 [subsurface metagenome]
MAKIKALPGSKAISGFKGVVDYYVWRGIACARQWPRSPGHKRAPAVMLQWSAFSEASKLWNTLSPEVQEAYKQMSAGTHWSGRDVFTKSYLSPLVIHLE